MEQSKIVLQNKCNSNAFNKISPGFYMGKICSTDESSWTAKIYMIQQLCCLFLFTHKI